MEQRGAGRVSGGLGRDGRRPQRGAWRVFGISLGLGCSGVVVTAEIGGRLHRRWNYVKAGGAGGAQSDFQLISFYATP